MPDNTPQPTLDDMRRELARAEAAQAHKRGARLRAVTATTAHIAAAQEQRRRQMETTLGAARERIAAAVARCESVVALGR